MRALDTLISKTMRPTDVPRDTEGGDAQGGDDEALLIPELIRLQDRVHLQDLDSVGLITPEVEATLSEPLRQRLGEVRASE